MGTTSLFWFVVLAAIGGVFVFVGLVMEQFAEKKWFKSVKSAKRWKRIRCIGELSVIFGVSVEVIIGGISASDEWANAPKNQIAENAKAIVTLWTAGTNNLRDILINAGPLTFATMDSKLAFGNPEMMSNGAPTMLTPVLSKLDFPVDGINRKWEIKFDTDDFVFWKRPQQVLKLLLGGKNLKLMSHLCGQTPK